MNPYDNIYEEVKRLYPDIGWDVDSFYPTKDSDIYMLGDIMLVGFTSDRKKYSAVVISLETYNIKGFACIKFFADKMYSTIKKEDVKQIAG